MLINRLIYEFCFFKSLIFDSPNEPFCLSKNICSYFCCIYIFRVCTSDDCSANSFSSSIIVEFAFSDDSKDFLFSYSIYPRQEVNWVFRLAMVFFIYAFNWLISYYFSVIFFSFSWFLTESWETFALSSFSSASRFLISDWFVFAKDFICPICYYFCFITISRFYMLFFISITYPSS